MADRCSTDKKRNSQETTRDRPSTSFRQLSNIAAGTVEQIQCVLDSGSIPPLVRLASSPETDPEVKSEACWVVLNATSCGSDLQIEYLVRQGCVDVLADLLSETSMVMMALEGLERILQVSFAMRALDEVRTLQ